MATIGRASAVVDMYWLRFSGFLAWLAWLFIHLIYLVRFSNRALVFMQWFWNYLTRNRFARLITGNDPHKLDSEAKTRQAEEEPDLAMAGRED